MQVQLSPKAAEEESFRNSEWGPEANEAIIKEVYNFNTPHGKLGEFIDKTPKDRISRVFLEDKLFETWHHLRTVLIGDGIFFVTMLFASRFRWHTNVLIDIDVVFFHSVPNDPCYV